MRSNLMAALLALLVTSCASGVTSPKATASKGRVVLLTLSPLAGSQVDEQTELVAEIDYRIEGFKPGVDYYIAPLFASTDRPGASFNKLNHVSESRQVSAPQGRITVRYPIRRELGSANLAHPVTVWFYLMERTGAETARIIGKTEPVTFKTAAD
jgi:hypothetical protein